jgi:hypothetical protein
MAYDKGTLLNNMHFYAYQLPDMLRFMLIYCDENLKLSLLGTTSFFGCSLSVRFWSLVKIVNVTF